jgi:hypothetical protein
MISETSLIYMMPVMLMVMTLLTFVNITNVLLPTKMNGECLLVQTDIHKSGVTVHSKLLLQWNAQVNGLVMILNGLLPPISTTLITTEMESLMNMMNYN